MFKIGDKVKLLSNDWFFENGNTVLIVNIHTSINIDGSKYEIFYHVKKNKEDRYEGIFHENKIVKL